MVSMARFLRAIVRNEAMRNDPPEIYGWRVFALVCSACFGGMLFGWETGAIGGILASQIRRSFLATLMQPLRPRQHRIRILSLPCRPAASLLVPLHRGSLRSLVGVYV